MMHSIHQVNFIQNASLKTLQKLKILFTYQINGHVLPFQTKRSTATPDHCYLSPRRLYILGDINKSSGDTHMAHAFTKYTEID